MYLRAYLLMVIILFAADVSAEEVKWSWMNPYPNGNAVTAMWKDESGRIYAVGEAGNSFTVEKNRRVKDLTAAPHIWFSSVYGCGGKIFASGYRGIVASLDEKKGWVNMDTMNTNDLNAVWCSSPSNVYAAGDRGTILHYDGTGWEHVPSGTHNLLFGIWGSSPSDIYAVGGRGTVLHFDGTQWVTVKGLKSAHFVGVTGEGPNDVYVYGDDGSIIHFDGKDWRDLSLDSEGQAYGGVLIRGIFVIPHKGLFAAADNGTVFAFEEGHWKLAAAADDMKFDRILGVIEGEDNHILFGDSGRLYSFDSARVRPLELNNKKVMTRRDLYKTTISGKSLFFSAEDVIVKIKNETNSEIMTGGSLWDIWQTDKSGFWKSDNTLYFAGSGGRLLKYGKNGVKTIETGVSKDLFGLWGNRNGAIYAAGSEGIVIKYEENKGVTIISDEKNTTNLFAVWGDDAGNIYAAGENGIILRFDGARWTLEASPTDSTIYAMAGSGSAIYAVGENGTIVNKTKEGWKALSSPVQGPLYDIWMPDTDRIFIAGARGTVLSHARDGHFDQVPVPTFNDLYGITGKSDRIVLAGEGGIIITGEIE